MIRFGTAGWRGIVGNQFTFRNVRLAVQAIADVLRDSSGGEIVVGYDTRFLSERFAGEAARVLSQNGFDVHFADRDTPTPVVAHATVRLEAIAGLSFTASHNPPEYNGLKLIESGGVAAGQAITDAVEARTNQLEKGFVDRYLGDPERVRTFDAGSPYLADLQRLVDLEAIAASGIRIAVDPLHGTGRGYLDWLLMEAGCDCVLLRNYRDPYFGGYSPAATPETLAPLQEKVTDHDCDLGLATDSDADRFAVVDGDGAVFDSGAAACLVAAELLGRGRISGPLARTVSTTHLLDRIAAAHGATVVETPVGFRHIGRLLHQGAADFGTEDSGAVGLGEHLPDKDGILAALLVTELVARRGRSLRQLLTELHQRVGPLTHVRRDLDLDPDLEASLEDRRESPPRHLGGRTVERVVTGDGVKLHFDQSWFLYRRSATEPVLRCHAEAPEPREARSLLEAGCRMLLEGTE